MVPDRSLYFNGRTYFGYSSEMIYKYPKLTQATVFYLSIIFLLQIFLIFDICMIAVHGTLWYKHWPMQNGMPLRWEVGLLSVSGSVNCYAEDQPIFHAVCMSVFKSLFDKIWNIKFFLCHIASVDLRIEQAFRPHADAFNGSCNDSFEFLKYSLITFGMLITVCFLICGGIVSLIALTYYRFIWKRRSLYWCLLGFNFLGAVMYITALATYYFSVPYILNNLFNYPNLINFDQTLIRNAGDNGMAGVAWYLSIISVAGVVLLLALSVFWVPIIPKDQIPPFTKKMPLAASSSISTSRTTKEVFWAYMPEIFQPNIYVTEIAEAEKNPSVLMTPTL